MSETTVEQVEEFEKDLKHLKKYRNLSQDIDRAIKAILTCPDNFHGSQRISGLGDNIKIPIFKLKKFHSSDIPGKGAASGFRLIYAYIKEENKLIKIEIYYHEREDSDCDKERIKKYFAKTA
jgi:mRNA-degrading endonuclease RelE of RelBE toxin-antitoxin system